MSSTSRRASCPSSSRHSTLIARSEEEGDDLRQQRALVEQDGPLGHLESSVRIPPQHMVAAPNEQVDFVEQPVVPYEEVVGDMDFRLVHAHDTDVRNDV